MQSPFSEIKTQKASSCSKPISLQALESSLKNKENHPSNIADTIKTDAEVECKQAPLDENMHKNAENFSSKKTHLETLKGALIEEIHELLVGISYYDAATSKQSDIKHAISNCDVDCDFTENTEESNFTNAQSASEKLNLNADQTHHSGASACNLADSSCAKAQNFTESLTTDKPTENEQNPANVFASENSGRIPKQASNEHLRQQFRILLTKVEKLLETLKEVEIVNFTETNFSNDFAHASDSHSSENKNNYLKNNNQNYFHNNYNCKLNEKSTKAKNEGEAKSFILTAPLAELPAKVTHLCNEKRFFCDLMNFYLRTGNEVKAVDLFLLKNIQNFNDYEEAVFSLAEDLTRNLVKIELLFQVLQYTEQNFVYSLYPVFSVCLHKLVKACFIQEAFVLKNYMLHFKLQISSLAINSLIEALCKNGRLQEAEGFVKEIENTNFIHLFQSACSDASEKDLDYCDSINSYNLKSLKSSSSGNGNNKHVNFRKLSLQAGLNLISYGILIKHLCKNNSIETALALYENLKANHLIKDEIIFNLLIDGCSKHSNLGQILCIYQDMINLQIKPSIVTFNTILDSYVRAKDLNSAWRIYEDICKFGCVPDNFTYSTLFRGIRNAGHKEFLEKAFLILEELSISNVNIDIILVNVLIDSCICLKDEKNLVKIFTKAVNGCFKSLSPDIITFNTFIKGCAQLNLFEQATKAFNILLSKQDFITPNDVSFNTMIDVYVRSENINLVWDLLELMKKYGIKPDNFTYSTIIKGINKKTNFNACNSNNRTLRCESLVEAELGMAFKLFENVKTHSKPDEILYNCIMDACLRFENIDKMMEYHEEMIRENVKPSSITCGILIKAYGMSGMVNKALEVYENMKHENIEISSITYGCLINACIKNNNLQKSFELYQELDANNIEMNTVLYTTMIKAYSKKSNLVKVIEIFEKMKKDKNNMPNNVTYNSVIDCCIKCNNMREAEDKFAEMKANKLRPDIITFSTLIKGCLKNSLLEKSVDYLHTMVDLGIKPDEVLLNSLLDGCEKMNKFTQARDIFFFVRKFGVEPSMMSFSIMMKIYGKLKDFQNSRLLIEEVKAKPKNCSLIIFTCYIKTCLQTKNFEEALSTYEALKSLGIQADQITFNTILKGLVINKAFEHIPRIIRESLLTPKTFCSFAIYSEALNALNKNLSKAKLTQSDLIEIRRSLALNNIFIEVSENASNSNNSYNFNNNDNTNKANMQVNNNAHSGFYHEHQGFYDNSISNDSSIRGNYSHKKGKNGRSYFNRNDKFKGPNNFNNAPEETYVDNFDFLINGYKNNKKHFANNNFNSNPNAFNSSFYPQASICDNSSSKRGKKDQAFKPFKNPKYTPENENNQSLHEQTNFINHSRINHNPNVFDASQNLNYFPNADESAFFDRPSFDISAIPRASEIRKACEENTSKAFKDTMHSCDSEIQNTNKAQPNNTLKERSAFYKNFANFNENQHGAGNWKNLQKIQSPKNTSKNNNEQEDFHKIVIPRVEIDKENIANENYNSRYYKGKQVKNPNISNYNYAYKEAPKNHSNALGNNESNIPNAKNQIFRKGFNMPLDAIKGKDASVIAQYSHTENVENSYSDYNADAFSKTNKRAPHYYNKAGITFTPNPTQNKQAVAKPVKKLTRF